MRFTPDNTILPVQKPVYLPRSELWRTLIMPDKWSTIEPEIN